MADLLRLDTEADGPARTRLSRTVSQDQVESAQLVLAVDLATRATLARLSPASVTKTFTLREAAVLVDCLGDAPAGPDAAGTDEPLRWLAEELDAVRGATRVPAPRRRSLRQPASFSPFDVPDAHSGSRRLHRRVFALLEEASAGLGRAVRPLLFG